MDLMEGQVVRGVAGRRKEYRPVVSRLTASSWPADVARAFRDHFGISELYVADLDAISGALPAMGVYASLQEDGFHLWVDAGVRDKERAVLLARAGVESVVVGLETAAGPEVLADAVRELERRLVFSLDLRDGVPLGEVSAWDTTDAESIARQAVQVGVGRVLVLDLARVGVGSGPGSRALCRCLVAELPHVEVSVGGGVRGRDDLDQLRMDGLHAVLVASALHDGSLRREDLQGL
jgi:phosphoribosylformimino-5-aminoimidazole carboxamide ribotide isomerase